MMPRSSFLDRSSAALLPSQLWESTVCTLPGGGGTNKRTWAGGGHCRFLGHLDFPQPLALLGQGFGHVFLVLLLIVRHVDVLVEIEGFII
jgi:hypothetical protein